VIFIVPHKDNHKSNPNNMQIKAIFFLHKSAPFGALLSIHV
jgi:hypothetical protein